MKVARQAHNYVQEEPTAPMVPCTQNIVSSAPIARNVPQMHFHVLPNITVALHLLSPLLAQPALTATKETGHPEVCLSGTFCPGASERSKVRCPFPCSCSLSLFLHPPSLTSPLPPSMLIILNRQECPAYFFCEVGSGIW